MEGGFSQIWSQFSYYKQKVTYYTAAVIVIERHLLGVSGIQGKWEQERERNTGTGTCINCCYSSDSSPVKFMELYKPSHWYGRAVKFFLLHNALSNKHPCNAV